MLTMCLCRRAAEESKYSDGRIIQCFMYVRSGSVHDNHYAHPLDLVVFLDMNTGRVLDTMMQANPPVIPQLNTNYLAPLVQKERGFRSGTLTDISSAGGLGILSFHFPLVVSLLSGSRMLTDICSAGGLGFTRYSVIELRITSIEIVLSVLLCMQA